MIIIYANLNVNLILLIKTIASDQTIRFLVSSFLDRTEVKIIEEFLENIGK
jgi:hypothetical protein